MVVKASTKKRLMDLGLPRLYAHLWANDIRMGELVQMNLEETMKHLYRQNGKIQEWVRRSPEDLMSYNTFCRVGPAFFQGDVNQFLLNSKTDCLMKHLSITSVILSKEQRLYREKGITLNHLVGGILDQVT